MSTHPLLDSLKKDPDRPARHEGWSLEAREARADGVGLSARELKLRRDRASARPANEIARDLSRRAGYLLEPLEMVEGSGERAILRSPPPPREGGDYYEMKLTPREMSLERFRGARGKRREPRPLNLTWEQAERLLRDIEATTGGDPD